MKKNLFTAVLETRYVIEVYVTLLLYSLFLITLFLMFRDPNVVHDLDMPEKTRGRFERFVWPLYDSVNQKFLTLGK